MFLSKEYNFDHTKHLDPDKSYLPWVDLTGLFFDVETTTLIPSIKLGKEFDGLSEEEKEKILTEKQAELDDQLDSFRIVQFCGILVREQEIIRTVNQIIDPEIPIPEESSRIHHIYDKDVVGMPTFGDFIPQLRELVKESDYLVAYNGNFDKLAVEKSIAWYLQRDIDTKVYDPEDDRIRLPLIDPKVWAVRRKQIDRFTKVFTGNKLSEIAKSYSVSSVASAAHGNGALHDAFTDTKILVELVHKMLERGDIPWTLQETIVDQVQINQSHEDYHSGKK